MNDKRKKIIMSILLIMVLAIGGTSFYYWYENNNYVTSEDAKVTGDIYRVSPQIVGKIAEFDLQEGQKVEKDQILARQEVTSLPPGANLDLAALKAPINGIIVKRQGNVGELVAPGQALVMIVNPDNLYINTNIEETKLGKIKSGQAVDLTIDQYPGKKFTGKVISIGQATNATFSLLPTSPSGNFTKVVQKVPVKISLDKTGEKLLPGTSAIVKIHVK
jgi:multidrug resistance efflux pump